MRSLKGQNAHHYQGHRPWNASWLFISCLETMQLDRCRIIDVGCGCGLASIYCARKGARVTAVDIDLLVFPFVEMLSDLNQVEVNPVTAGFAQVGEELLTDVDLLIGAMVFTMASHLVIRAMS
ncbi:MAG: hypothetical protein CME24_12455 [Gemmatimonadetes bacterium]|nr:hypothetical protein [Gemmatimonadota bacterium]